MEYITAEENYDKVLERRTAFITGAASGIGLETVVRLSKDSRYNPIYAVDKDHAVNTMFPEYPNVVAVQLDVREREQITGLLRSAASESGRLDVVVNAAGVMSKGKPWNYRDKDGNPTAELTEMDKVNLWAPIYIMVEASGIMRENGGGTIINVTSAKYLFPDLYHIPYQVGKRDLSRVTRGVARHFLKSDNVRVVDVQPGNTKTNIDRGDWTKGNSRAEIDAVQGIADWWRKTFGNDPRNVAEVIYQVAEGRIRSKTVYVGWDTRIGHALHLLTYPLLGYRSDSLFFFGSTMGYQVARLRNALRRKLKL